MAENQYASPASDEPEWQALVDDVERRFDALNVAFADLREAVARLTVHSPAMTAASNGWSAPPSEEPQVETAELVAAFEEAATAFEAETASDVASEEQWAAPEPEVTPEPETMVEPAATMESPAAAEPVATTEPPAAAEPEVDEEARRREEVSRMVAQAKQELSARPLSTSEGSWPSTSEGSWPVTKSSDSSEMDSTSEGSWPMAGGPVKGRGLPHAEPPERASVESPKDDVVAAAESVAGDAEQDDEARREEVARMVAEMRAGLTTDEAEEAPSVPGSAQPRRDVGKMIADMRANLVAGDESGSDAEDALVYEDEAPASEPATEQKGSAADEVVRDEVRRAVEAAKAEMAAGWVKAAPEPDGPADGGESKFSFPDWQNTRIEPSGPPVIVIKDTEGRVELARVYETLSHVKCDENAALLNYTPHSVTVGLNTRAQVPTKEALEEAVRVVFGRKCRVESDGVRLSVDIGKDLGKEDAA